MSLKVIIIFALVLLTILCSRRHYPFIEEETKLGRSDLSKGALASGRLRVQTQNYLLPKPMRIIVDTMSSPCICVFCTQLNC